MKHLELAGCRRHTESFWVLSCQKMSGSISVDAVKKKIKVLQDQVEEAMERAERLQKEVEKERRTREEVQTPFHLYKMVVGV